MRQNYCFDCGIPVKNELQRIPNPFQLVYFCLTCANNRKYPIDHCKQYGVFWTTIPFGERPHLPRWNYPNKDSHKETVSYTGDIIYNINGGDILIFDGKEWKVIQIQQCI